MVTEKDNSVRPKYRNPDSNSRNSSYYHHNKQSSKKSDFWNTTFWEPIFEFLHCQRSLTALWFTMLNEKTEEQEYLK